jgi:hypothetical protein
MTIKSANSNMQRGDMQTRKKRVMHLKAPNRGNCNIILSNEVRVISGGMHPNLLGRWTVPRSLISQRVKIPPVRFTRIG